MNTFKHADGGLQGTDLLQYMKTKSEQGDILNEDRMQLEESNNCNFLFVKRHLASTSIFDPFLMTQGSGAKSNGSSLRFWR